VPIRQVCRRQHALDAQIGARHPGEPVDAYGLPADAFACDRLDQDDDIESGCPASASACCYRLPVPTN
jgi:hypothetical protein